MILGKKVKENNQSLIFCHFRKPSSPFYHTKKVDCRFFYLQLFLNNLFYYIFGYMYALKNRSYIDIRDIDNVFFMSCCGNFDSCINSFKFRILNIV